MFSVEVKGIVQAADKLSKAVDVLEKGKVEPIVLKGANKLRRFIRMNAPKGPTGNLKRGMQRKLLPRRIDYPVVGVVKPNYKIAPHTHLVEEGHGGPHPAGAHPFFVPIAQSKGPVIQKEIMDEIKANLDKALR